MDVFCTSPWVPPEWIQAHGLNPRGIWLEREFDTEHTGLAAGVCAFAHAASWLTQQQPEAAMVFTTHCDQLRREFDAVAAAANGRTFLFNLPATWQTPVAPRIFADELKRLGRFLLSLGGHAPSSGELRAIRAQRSLARQRLLDAPSWCPARQYAEAVARFHLDGSIHLPPQPAPQQPPGATPVAVVGGPLPRSQMPLLDTIERAGGRVVLNATEAGERSLGSAPPPHAAPQDDVEQLARDCLANCVDVFQRPNTRLYDWLRQRLVARGVRGIVLWHYVGCDLWRAEAQPLRDTFGLPVLLLEADSAALTRNTGRLEAFLESLR
jgi:hypothetical protein